MQGDAARRLRRHVRLAMTLAIAMSVTHAGDALAVSWTANRTIAAGGTAWAEPASIAVSSSTVAHLVYEQGVVGTFGAYYRRSADSGSTWSTPFRLSRANVGEAGVPTIEAWGTNVDAVWLEGDNILAGLDTVVMYRRSTDAGVTWAEAVALSPPQESAGTPRVSRRGSIVAVTWTDELTGKVFVKVSTDGGGSWKARVALTTSTRKVGSRYEAFPAVAVGTGVIYVAYYNGSHSLRIRRSTTSGSSWSSYKTLATNGNGWYPTVAASGSKAIVGYAASTSTDSWAVIRRTSDSGATWGSVITLGSQSSYPSFSPVVAVRGSRWMAIYEKCTSNSCSASDVIYKASTNSGSTWSTASKASVRKRKWEAPADVDVATKTLVLYIDYDTKGNDVYLRQGS